MKIKGLQEEAVKPLGFPRLSIFRPGALDRGELRQERGKERFMGFIGMSGIPVSTVAKGIRADMEQKNEAGESTPAPYGDADIERLAAL